MSRIEVQDADVSLVQSDLLSVYELGHFSSVDIVQLDHRMNMFRNRGKAGFLVKAYIVLVHNGIEFKDI